MVTAEEQPVEMDPTEKKIIEQVEYYFGDINLRNDKFIQQQMNINDGWFPLEKLMTFNKLKAITTDRSAIVAVLKKSELIELSECETKIRRIKPLPEFSEEYIKQLNERTLHLKGFAKESTFEDIKTFCSQYGEIESLEMRKRNKNFKGCIFVVYKEINDANKILGMEELKYNDIELLKENKQRYFERKQKFYQSLKNKKNKLPKNDIIKTEGAILKIKNVSSEIGFNVIKTELSKHSKVAFVEFKESQECYIRFEEKNGAKVALKALRETISDSSEDETKIDSIELFGHMVNVSLATEEEEKEFWAQYKNRQSNYSKKKKWQSGKKRPNKNTEDEDNVLTSPRKIAKVDD